MSSAAPTSPAAGGRRPSLDGLRGVAALVVMCHHIVLIVAPELSNALVQGTGLPPGTLRWALLETPLGVVWAGQEWVIVFFVLSGFVLALPYATGRSAFDPLGYYPARILRLLVPVWGAIVVALVLRELIPRDGADARTLWLLTHTNPLGPTEIRDDALLVLGGLGGAAVLTVLWSLQWELWFSLLLPAFLMGGAVARRSTWPVVVAVVALLVVSTTGDGTPWMRFMPTFALGVVLAFRLADVERLARRLAAPRASLRAGKLALAVGSLVALSADRWLGPSQVARTVAPVLVALGATGLVVLPLLVTRVRLLLETPVAQWVGQRSFSLYLVHEAVIVSLAFALPGTPRTLYAPLAVLLSLLAADLFFRGVEGPAHRLSKWVGRSLRGRLPAAQVQVR